MKKRLLFFSLTIMATLAESADIYPQYQALVEKHAAAQGLDKNLVWAVMGRESSGNRYALSNKNAQGLMQIIPSTAARMGVDPKLLYQPEPNLMAATRYLRFLSNRYQGNTDLILAAYNAGEGAVDKYKGIPPYRETVNYVKAVRQRYARLSGGTSAYRPMPAVTRHRSVSPVKPVSAPRQYAEWDVFREF